MTYSIGEFDFLALHGNPEPLKEQCVLAGRPGVEGVAVWKTSPRGVRFTLRSAVDAESLTAARWLFGQYKTLIGGDPVELVWAGLAMTGESFQVVVLDCRPAEIKSIIGGVGGLYPPSIAWCECDWDLVAVATEPEK